jgi:hypothetical protein
MLAFIIIKLTTQYPAMFHTNDATHFPVYTIRCLRDYGTCAGRILANGAVAEMHYTQISCHVSVAGDM